MEPARGQLASKCEVVFVRLWRSLTVTSLSLSALRVVAGRSARLVAHSLYSPHPRLWVGQRGAYSLVCSFFIEIQRVFASPLTMTQ